MEKRLQILEGLIKEYIKHPAPISSSYLQNKLNLNLSSATIRYYFKQLTESGYLVKQHVSSGRIPSNMALKFYWRQKFKDKNFYYISNKKRMQEGASTQNIFYEYSIYKDAVLQSIENYKNRFLIAVFDDEELVISYNYKIEKLLQSLIGQSAFEIARYCSELGLKSLAMQIKEFHKEDFQIFNVDEIVTMAQSDKDWAQENLAYVLCGKKLSMERAGLNFYNLFLSYKFYVKLPENRRGEVLLMGNLYRDYQRFIKNLTKE